MTKQLLTLYISSLIALSGGCQTGKFDYISVPDPEHPGQTIACGPEGTAHNSSSKLSHLAWIGSPLKNRYDFFDSSKVITINIEELIALAAIKTKFTEGTPVQVTGYVVTVKSGDKETCNCETNDQNYMDTHIEITPNSKDTTDQFKMIVEVTPRLREEMSAKGVDWKTSTLKKTLLHETIAIQGWLFYDEIHEPEAFATNPENKSGKDWRASCWEIHPITSIKFIPH